MGFWPYFLQDQESEGGPSFLCFLFSLASIFTVTTVFSDIFLWEKQGEEMKKELVHVGKFQETAELKGVEQPMNQTNLFLEV